ncbi:hypothetical protein ABZP36_014290 [Zizania latifolia]
MASRLLVRSRALALAISRAGTDATQPLAGARALSSLSHYSPVAAVPFRPRQGARLVVSRRLETCKSVVGMEEGTSPKVVALSPLEAAIAKPRSTEAVP